MPSRLQKRREFKWSPLLLHVLGDVFTQQAFSAHRAHQLQSIFSTKGLMHMCCSLFSHHCECSHTSALKHKSCMSNLQSFQSTWTKIVSTQCSGLTYDPFFHQHDYFWTLHLNSTSFHLHRHQTESKECITQKVFFLVP